MKGQSILNRILSEAAQAGTGGRPLLAVFDLDSTLFDLTLRVSRIVDHFAQQPENRARFPKECELLKDIQILRSDWGLGEALTRMGMNESEHSDFYRALHHYWASCFFSNDYLHCDEPLPGAVHFVQELRRRGAHIMYLTGRDVPRMLKGTEDSLKSCGFPIHAADVQLVLKPSADLDDARFKVDILKEAEPAYSRIWLFENEPVNLNLVAKECPEIGLVFIETTHSGREQLAGVLDRIKHFEVDAEDFAE